MLEVLATTDEDPVNKIRAVNRVLRGWANYYRHVASYDTRKRLDNWVTFRMLIWFRRKHGGKLNNEELYARYKQRDRKGWKNWMCEGVSLFRMGRDIKWRLYKLRTIPHPYLDPNGSLTIQDEEPVTEEDVWRGTSSQNRYAIARLQRMREVNYTCESCQKGPLAIAELEAHHLRGKDEEPFWAEIQILCHECHVQTPSYGRKRLTGVPESRMH